MEDYHTGKTSVDSLSEEDLVALLTSLRKEATPEAHFEERFLYDFHERIAREAVCRPARTLLWEHIRQFLSNLCGRKLAYSASTLGAGMIALGIYSFQDSQEVLTNKASFVGDAALVDHMDNSLDKLNSEAQDDFDAISVGETENKSFSRNRLSLARHKAAYAIQDESDVLYVSSSRPVNMGLPSGMDSDFPSLTTNLAF